MGRKAIWPPKVSVHAVSNQARVFFRGREYPLGKAGSPAAQRAYADLLLRLLAEGQATAAPPAGPCVSEVAAAWLTHARQRYAESEEAREHDRAMAPVLALCGPSPASDFTAVALERVRDAMIAKGWCRNVVNRRVGRIKTAWRWAEQRGLVPPGSWGALRAMAPLSRADRRAPSTPAVRPVAWPVVCAVARQLCPSARGLLLTLWFTGARPGELFGLKVAEAQAGSVVLEKHKNAWRGQAREIVFGARAQALLRPLCRDKAPEALVFPNARGGAFDRGSFARRLRRAAARAGVQLTAYRLRHSFATRVAAGHGLQAAQAALGHKSLASTQVYAEADRAKVLDVMRQVG